MKSAIVAAVLMMAGVEGAMRVLTIKNSCPASVGTIQVGFTAGAPRRPGCEDGEDCSIPCKSDDDCHALNSNSFCSSVGHCFYNAFMPGNFAQLTTTAPGNSKYFNITIQDQKQYSGTIFGSTGCDNPNYKWACETAICVSDKHDKVCPPDKGSTGPRTIAEFTFDTLGKDFYDVSFIEGLNVPMSMRPIGGPIEPGDPYSCAASGAANPVACRYAYSGVVNGTDQTTNMVFVVPATPDASCEGGVCPASGAACTGDSQCTVAGEVCGLSAGRNSFGYPTNTVTRVCGKPAGLWSSREVCSYAGDVFDVQAPYFCKTPTWHGTKENLYKCDGSYAKSGYQSDSPDADTCGCVDWPGIHATEKCQHFNPEWGWYSLPWLKPFKDLCQTAYAYPFDDMASTFTCRGQNFLNYEIEFCPSGVTLHKT